MGKAAQTGDTRGVQALAELPSLGLPSARTLAEAGVATPKQLEKLGAEEAWRRLRFHFGHRISVNWIYALECAIRGLHWRDLDPERKSELRAAARAVANDLAARARAAD